MTGERILAPSRRLWLPGRQAQPVRHRRRIAPWWRTLAPPVLNMATAGQRLLNASGQRILTPDGKQRNSDGTDECAAECCYETPGPTTVAITFAGCVPCDCLFGPGLAAKLSGTFAGTFTLNRTGFDGFAQSCFYFYDGAFSTVTFDLYEDVTQAAGGDASEISECDDPIICSTTRIRITLQTPPANTPPSTGWELWVELYKSLPTGCECGERTRDPEPDGFVVNAMGGAFPFYANGIDLDPCGDTVVVDNQGECTTAGPDCSDAVDAGFTQPLQEDTVAVGGTAAITL